MKKTRVNYTKRNILSGFIKQFFHLSLAFAIRTVIIYVLGAEYQGLTGLFTSILHVLNLADLGFSIAVTYILYKPIANNDSDSICAILNYLKKIYVKIGIIILGSGLLITPFLSFLIHSDVPDKINIYILFLIYLVNTSASYFLFAYKSTLLIAMQREDIVSNVYTFINTIISIAQLSVLLLFKNYYVYICFLPIGTIINSVLLQFVSKRILPSIRPYGEIDQSTRQELTKQIKAVFIGKVSDVARNSFDSIVISMLLGLISVTAYDNYYYIYNAVYGIMGIIIHGIMASVGNSIAVESVEKNYKDLQKFNFMFMWIVSWCTICMLCIYQPFMTLWMKNKPGMLLSDFNMILFCLYFYCINMTYPRSMYLDGFGLFHECRFTFAAEALLNLILNFVLGYLWGITGIIIATILTIFILNFITRTNILFRYYFKRSPFSFYSQHIYYFIVTIIAASITYIICNVIKLIDIGGILVRLSLCAIIPNIIMVLFYSKNKQFREALSFITRLIKSKN